MLAKATPLPLHLPPPPMMMRWKVKAPHRRRPSGHGCLQFVGHKSFCNSSWSIGGGHTVRAGYTRTPLETPGAYQLIDDETGDKFIVWGGIDDNDQSLHSPIPSKHHLLSSNWTYNRPTTTPSHSCTVDAPPASTTGSAGTFGRLKAQRVKALVKKASRTKQEINKHDDEQVSDTTLFDKSIGSTSKLGSMGNKEIVNSLRHKGRISRASQSQETYENTDDFDGSVKHGVEQISEYYTAPDRPHKSGTKRAGAEVSDHRGSDVHLRGWGNGGSIHNLISKSTDLLKQRHKLSTESDFFSQKSFRDLGCSEYMIESLKVQLFLRPSHIQAMAFAPVIEGKSCIIADQSGSGKTLAYLVPLIQRLRQEELQGLGEFSSRSPQVVIIVPTAELASQVLCNCRAISKLGVPFRSMVVTGGFRHRTQLENLQQGVDVLIATPGRFMFLIKEGFLQLTNLRCAVLDEVDLLINDEDFEVALQILINNSPVSAQYLFVTATLPVDVYNKLVEAFPDCEVIMGPGMHRISPRLEEVLVDCSGDDGTEKTPDAAFLNKKSALLRLVEKSPVSKTIVFCNKIETCRKVENVLKRFDRKGTCVRVLPFHAALSQELRLANMKEFTSSQCEGDSLFLVCTDRASRGIDFTGVNHVVLFDFPRDPSEYVRRVGRTARGARGKGKAFVFVVGKQVSLARKIMERNLKGHPLHDVPSAYELMR